MAEMTLAMVLAWWTAVFLVSIGTYLVFFAETNTPMVIAVGSLQGLLGAAIYLIVRQPLWAQAHIPNLPDAVLPVALGLILLYIVLSTLLLWNACELDRPHKRLKKLMKDIRRHGPRW